MIREMSGEGGKAADIEAGEAAGKARCHQELRQEGDTVKKDKEQNQEQNQGQNQEENQPWGRKANAINVKWVNTPV